MKKILSLMLALCMILSLCTSLAIVPVSAEYTKLDTEGFTITGTDVNGTVIMGNWAAPGGNWDMARKLYHNGIVPPTSVISPIDANLLLDTTSGKWVGGGHHTSFGGDVPANKWPLNFDVNFGGLRTLVGVVVAQGTHNGYETKSFKAYVKNTVAGETVWTEAGTASVETSGQNIELLFDRTYVATDVRIQLTEGFFKVHMGWVGAPSNLNITESPASNYTIIQGFEFYGSEDVDFDSAALAEGEEVEKDFYKSNPEDISYEFALTGSAALSGVTLGGEEVNEADYTFEDNTLTFDSEYLAAFENDSINVFTVNFGEGLSVDVTVSVYEESPTGVWLAEGEEAFKEFEKVAPLNVEFAFELMGNVAFAGVTLGGEAIDAENYTYSDDILTIKKEYLLEFEDEGSYVFVVDFGNEHTVDVTIEVFAYYDMVYNLSTISVPSGDGDLRFDVPEGKIIFKLMAGDIQLNATQEGTTVSVSKVDFRNAVDLFKVWADEKGNLDLTIVYLDEDVQEYKVKIKNIAFAMDDSAVISTGDYASDEIIPQGKNWSVAVSSSHKANVEDIFSSEISQQTYHSNYWVATSGDVFSCAYKGNQHYMDIDLAGETAFSGIRYYGQELENGNVWNNTGAWNKVSVYGRNSKDEEWVPLLEDFELNMSSDLSVPRNKAITLPATAKCRYVRIQVQDSQFSIVRALRFLKPKSAFKSAEIINNPVGMDVELEEDAVARFNLNGAAIITGVTLADGTEIPEGYITIDKNDIKISYLYFVNNGYTEEGTEIDMKAKFAFGDEVLFKVKVGEAEGYKVFYAVADEGLNGTVSAIAYNDISGDRVKSSGDKVRATDELTFVATPSAGYEVIGWDIYVVDDSGEAKISATEPELEVLHKGTASEEVKIVDRFDNMKVVATFGEIEGAGVENVSLEYNLENVTAESRPSTAIIGNDLSLSFASDVENDYYMPEDVVVKMDGDVLKKGVDYAYERSGLVISAEDPDAFESATLVVYNVKGNKLTIEVKGADLETYSVIYDDDKGATGTLPEAINVGKGRTFVVASANLQLSGYKFAGWVCNEETYNVGDVVTMGDADMVMLAKWIVDNSKPDGGYIGGNNNNNTGKDDKNTFGGGMIVGGTDAIYTIVIAGVEGKTLQVLSGAIIEEPASKEGYTFAGYYLDAALTIPYKNDGAKGSVTLYPSWVKRTRDDLKDIQNHWAKDYIGDLYERSIVNGNGEGTFSPDSNITRAEFVQILYNMSGATFDGAQSFRDIAEADWYSKAVSWAVSAGITQGMSEDTFAPSVNITREQMAVMIYRYATLMGADWNITNDSEFADSDAIEDYAKYQVRWAKDKGIIEGRPDGTFGAKDYATRAETAAMLSRLVK